MRIILWNEFIYFHSQKNFQNQICLAKKHVNSEAHRFFWNSHFLRESQFFVNSAMKFSKALKAEKSFFQKITMEDWECLGSLQGGKDNKNSKKPRLILLFIILLNYQFHIYKQKIAHTLANLQIRLPFDALVLNLTFRINKRLYSIVRLL